VTDRLSQLKEALDKVDAAPWTFHPDHGSHVRFGGEGAMNESGDARGSDVAEAIVLLRNNADALIAVAEAASAYHGIVRPWPDMDEEMEADEVLRAALQRLRGDDAA